MEPQQREIHIDAERARAGATPNIMRWVLGIGLALAVIVLSAVWIVPSLSGERTIDEVPQRATPAETG